LVQVQLPSSVKDPRRSRAASRGRCRASGRDPQSRRPAHRSALHATITS